MNLNPRQLRITAIGIQVAELQVNTGAISHMHIRECSRSRMIGVVMPIMVNLGMRERVEAITIGITRA